MSTNLLAPPYGRKKTSAYYVFVNEKRAEILKTNKSIGFGELAKQLGERWRELSYSDKVAYEEMANKYNALYKDDDEDESDKAEQSRAE